MKAAAQSVETLLWRAMLCSAMLPPGIPVLDIGSHRAHFPTSVAILNALLYAMSFSSRRLATSLGIGSKNPTHDNSYCCIPTVRSEWS